MAVLVVAFFQKEKLPENIESPGNLLLEPTQTKTDTAPFEVSMNGVTYIIKPLFAYDLYGMVVSQHASSSWFDYYHDKWNDFLNLKDVCVVWGKNVENASYKYFDFYSGSWTCYAKSKPGIDEAKWSQFGFNQISNNHLLSNSAEINKKILSAEKGDRIHLKGYLVEYSTKDGSFKRGTSITRDDGGNGACETVFLTDFEIIGTANSFWRNAFVLAGYSAFISFIILTAIYLKEN